MRKKRKQKQKIGGDGERAKVGEKKKKEDGQVRSFWATQVYPSKCYYSRRTSMDVLFVRDNKTPSTL